MAFCGNVFILLGVMRMKMGACEVRRPHIMLGEVAADGKIEIHGTTGATPQESPSFARKIQVGAKGNLIEEFAEKGGKTLLGDNGADAEIDIRGTTGPKPYALSGYARNMQVGANGNLIVGFEGKGGKADAVTQPDNSLSSAAQDLHSNERDGLGALAKVTMHAEPLLQRSVEQTLSYKHGKQKRASIAVGAVVLVCIMLAITLSILIYMVFWPSPEGEEARRNSAEEEYARNKAEGMEVESMHKVEEVVQAVNDVFMMDNSYHTKNLRIGYIGSPANLQNDAILETLQSLAKKLQHMGHQLYVGPPNSALEQDGVKVQDMNDAAVEMFDLVLIAPGGPGALQEARRFEGHARLFTFINSSDEQFGSPPWMKDLNSARTFDFQAMPRKKTARTEEA